MQEFVINDHITLKLEEGDTNIYINGELFRQCRFIPLYISTDKITSFDDLESVDETFSRALELDKEYEFRHEIIPRLEFWVNCSNLQVWAMHNYNTRLLHRTLAFPLLKKLTDTGDSLAKKVFKKEIIQRFKSKYRMVQFYLIMENYLSYLSHEEIEELFGRKISFEDKDEKSRKRHLLRLLMEPAIKEGGLTTPTLSTQEVAIIFNAPESLIDIGVNFFKNKQYDKALDTFEQALRVDPFNYKALNNIGVIYNIIGKYDKAINYFKKALNILEEYDPETFKKTISQSIRRLNENIENFSRENNLQLNPYCYNCASKISSEDSHCPSCGYIFSLEFKVNEYITLRLEDKNTNIYVNGEFFNQCKYLLIDIPKDRIEELDNIESIDEAAEKLDNSLHPIILENERFIRINKIPPETEFWGHCSNLQAWSELSYNTNLIHSNLAFPLLKRLTDIGDSLAKKVFKEEIAKRFKNGNKTVILYLIKEGYFKYLKTREEKEIIFCENNEKLKELLNDLLNENGKLLSEGIVIVRTLLDLGDDGVKKILKHHIVKAAKSKNLKALRLYRGNFLLEYLTDEDKKMLNNH